MTLAVAARSLDDTNAKLHEKNGRRPIAPISRFLISSIDIEGFACSYQVHLQSL